MEKRKERRKKEKDLKKIMKKIRATIFSEEFLNENRISEKDFSRKSKLGFEELILFQLNALKESLQNALKKFIKSLKHVKSYTKQAYSEARRKIDFEVFCKLNEILLLEYYKLNTYKTHKGYRIMAIDGSNLRLPNTKELKETFGEITSQSDITLAAARASVLYDVENKIVIDSIIERYMFNERELAIKHIEKLKELKEKSNNDLKELVLFDRGYPSLKLMLYLEKNNINYLMRVSGSFLKEVNKFKKGKKDEEVLEITLTKQRIKKIGLKEIETKEKSNIKVRVLRIKLNSGEEEILITSLMNKKEFSHNEFKELYFKRWGIEVNYNILKNIIELENFTGIKPIAIKQDFYATMLVGNIKSLFESVAQVRVEENNESKNNKYDYQINKNLSHGVYKENIILLLRKKKGSGRILKKILYEIEVEVTPIRVNRSFPRKIKYGNAHPMNRKRA